MMLSLWLTGKQLVKDTLFKKEAAAKASVKAMLKDKAFALLVANITSFLSAISSFFMIPMLNFNKLFIFHVYCHNPLKN